MVFTRYKLQPPKDTVPSAGAWSPEQNYERACKKVGVDFANLFMCNAVATTEFDMKDGKPPRQKVKTVYRCELDETKVVAAWKQAKNLYPSVFAEAVAIIMEVMETGVDLDLPRNPDSSAQVLYSFKEAFESHARDADSAPDSDASMTGYWIINNPMLVAGVAIVVKTWAHMVIEDELGSLMMGQLNYPCFQRKMEEEFQPFLEANIRSYWANR